MMPISQILGIQPKKVPSSLKTGKKYAKNYFPFHAPTENRLYNKFLISCAIEEWNKAINFVKKYFTKPIK